MVVAVVITQHFIVFALLLYLGIELLIGLIYQVLRLSFPSQKYILPFLVMTNSLRFGLIMAWAITPSPSSIFLNAEHWLDSPIVLVVTLLAVLIGLYWITCLSGPDFLIGRLARLRQKTVHSAKP